jgi:hypothetical protein
MGKGNRALKRADGHTGHTPNRTALLPGTTHTRKRRCCCSCCCSLATDYWQLPALVRSRSICSICVICDVRRYRRSCFYSCSLAADNCQLAAVRSRLLATDYWSERVQQAAVRSRTGTVATSRCVAKPGTCFVRSPWRRRSRAVCCCHWQLATGYCGSAGVGSAYSILIGRRPCSSPIPPAAPPAPLRHPRASHRPLQPASVFCRFTPGRALSATGQPASRGRCHPDAAAHRTPCF